MDTILNFEHAYDDVDNDVDLLLLHKEQFQPGLSTEAMPETIVMMILRSMMLYQNHILIFLDWEKM